MKVIKSISVNTAYVNQEGSVEHEFLSNYSKYDQDGRIVEEAVITDKNELDSKITYKYNDQGQLVEEISWISEDETGEIKKYTYDSDGRIKNMEIIYGDGSAIFQTTEYLDRQTILKISDEEGNPDGYESRTYNEEGKLVEFARADEDNAISEKILYQYDENQNLTMTVEIDRDNDIRIRHKFTYDEKNRRTAETGYSARGEIMFTRTYKYNDLDQPEEETFDDHTTVFEYNDDGKDARHLSYSGEELVSIDLFRYNDDGLLAEEISIHAGKTYTLTPELLGESNTNYLSKKYIYEFYDHI